MEFLLGVLGLVLLVLFVAIWTYRNRSKIDSVVTSAEAKVDALKDVAKKL